MDIVTLDAETFYDQDYSLSKMPTDAYVTDARFEVIGLSIKVNGQATDWYSGKNWREFLQGFDFSDKAILGHNTVFDGYILTHHCGIRPKVWLDTMSMFRGMHGSDISASLANAAKFYGLREKGTEVVNAKGKRRKDFTPAQMAAYADYCMLDTDLTWELFNLMLPTFPKLELKLIDLTLRMFLEPEFILDGDGLEDHLTSVQARKQALLDLMQGVVPQEDDHSFEAKEARAMAAAIRIAFPDGLDKKTLMSNPKFAAALERMGVTPPMKISKTTNKLTFAFAKTDQGFLDLLEHDHPGVRAMAAARLGTKSTIEETRVQGLIEAAYRGPVPIGLNYAGAKTKRWSGGAGGTKLNFQNMPGRSKIKSFIQAPEGFAIVGADLSNIELRVGLWLAGELEKLKALGAGLDLYKDFASKVFDVPYDDVDGEQRFVGKTSCIAEGQLVLTPRGLVPIQDIRLDDQVWDGVEWVAHDGVIYQGERDVYEYQGLIATTDHKVYLEDGNSCEFGQAANASLRIACTGDGRHPVPLMADHHTVDQAQGPSYIPPREVPVRLLPVGTQRQSGAGDLPAVPYLRNGGSALSGWAPDSHLVSDEQTTETRQCNAAAMHQPQRSELSPLRRAWNSVWVRLYQAWGRVRAGGVGVAAGGLIGPDRQRWALCPGQPAVGYTVPTNGQPTQHRYGPVAGSAHPTYAMGREPIQLRPSVEVCASGIDGRGDSTAGMGCRTRQAQGVARYKGKARVYDLLNAGPRHRFTVSGVLVSNCLSLIYGVGAAKLQEALIIGAKNFLGITLDISLEECKRIVAIYRAEHKGVVRCWEEGKDALQAIHAGHETTMFHKGLAVIDGHHGIRLPSGLHLKYHNLRQMEMENRRNWVCDARRGVDKLYGAKVFQQFTQATARCVLAEPIPKIHKRYPVKLTIHDANYALVPEDKGLPALAWVLKQMIQPPAWMPDIPLDAEGGVGPDLKACGVALLKTQNGQLIHVPTKRVLSGG